MGIQEGGQAGELVGVQHPRFHRHHEDQGHADQQHHQNPDGQPGHRQHHQQDDEHDDRRAQVGLGQDQGHGYGGQDEQLEHVAPGQPLLIPPGAVGGHGHDQPHHGELGRLDLEGSEAEPALRTLDVAPHHEHPQQRQDGQDVQRHGDRFEPPVVEEGDAHHDQESEHHVQRLFLHVEVRVVPGGQEAAPGRRVHHHHADGRHQDRGQDEDEVEHRPGAPGTGRPCDHRHTDAILTRRETVRRSGGQVVVVVAGGVVTVMVVVVVTVL